MLQLIVLPVVKEFVHNPVRDLVNTGDTTAGVQMQWEDDTVLEWENATELEQ